MDGHILSLHDALPSSTGGQAGATQMASVSTLADGARCITAAGADAGRLPAHRCGPATDGRWADIRPVATRAGGVGAVGSADRQYQRRHTKCADDGAQRRSTSSIGGPRKKTRHTTIDAPRNLYPVETMQAH